MNHEIHTCLQGILHHLAAVGDLLSALDRDELNASAHWQAIREHRDSLPLLASQLPVGIRERLPQLQAFASSNQEIAFCWGACYDETLAVLQAVEKQV